MPYPASTRALLAILFAVTPLFAQAETLFDLQKEYGPVPTNTQETFSFNSPGDDAQLGYQIMAKLSQGKLFVRAADGEGFGIFETSVSQESKVDAGTFVAPLGAVEVHVEPQDCVGEWQLVVVEMPPKRAYYPMLTSGPLMMLVALAFVVVWARKSGAKLRWFWVGAGIWAVGVALKIGWAIATNEAILGALRNALPHGLYIALGSIYIGVLTGVFEIGITLVFAWKWRQMARYGNRAVAVGIGAGAIEAFLLGLAGLGQVVVLLTDVPGTDLAAVMAAYLAASTSVVWLVGPVERILAILCHMSSRTLVLLGVAQGRWAPFWYGFLVITVIDTIAGWIHLSGNMGQISLWWIELALAPAAIAGLPIVVWCLKRWPPSPESRPESDPELAPGS